jgi:putative transposase
MEKEQSGPVHLHRIDASQNMRRFYSLAICQSALNIHPFYLSNIHPLLGDQRLACPALAGVAEGRPSAGDEYLRL